MARLSGLKILNMDRDWLKVRRALLKSVKDDVRRRLGDDPRDGHEWDAAGGLVCDRKLNRPGTVAEIEAAIGACGLAGK